MEKINKNMNEKKWNGWLFFAMVMNFIILVALLWITWTTWYNWNYIEPISDFRENLTGVPFIDIFVLVPDIIHDVYVEYGWILILILSFLSLITLWNFIKLIKLKKDF